MTKKHFIIMVFLTLLVFINNDSRVDILILLFIPIGLGIILLSDKKDANDSKREEVEVQTENSIDNIVDSSTYNRDEKLSEINSALRGDTTSNDTQKEITEDFTKSKEVASEEYFKDLSDYAPLKILMNKSTSKRCFIGVGGGGSNILSDISHINKENLFIHVNSDYNALVQKQSEYKILLKSDSKNNKWGCGGNTSCGLNLVDDNVKKTIQQFSIDFETVYLIATLGGGVGSGSTPEIANYLKLIHKKVIIYVTLPFNFEGKSRLAVAQESLIELKKHADDVVIFENNELLQRNKGLRDTFKLSSIDIYFKILDEDSLDK